VRAVTVEGRFDVFTMTARWQLRDDLALRSPLPLETGGGDGAGDANPLSSRANAWKG
jgi:hypothetical protein